MPQNRAWAEPGQRNDRDLEYDEEKSPPAYNQDRILQLVRDIEGQCPEFFPPDYSPEQKAEYCRKILYRRRQMNGEIPITAPRYRKLKGAVEVVPA
ncbi:MAG: hypothetical protein A4E35_01865 [Methanoregula sp. PtaU1.Bin051]|nr:MAG: hypothetical protein A4E35_01865 [Methanoregula sp. PtaU1.Bin051]